MMNKFLILIAFCTVCLQPLWGADSGALVWRLGKTDGSNAEFRVPYRPWEYGREPRLARDPNMDHKTMTYRYTVPENGVVASPDMIAGLSTRSVRRFMPYDEVATGAEIVWDEKEAGTRELDIALSGFTCYAPGLKGITVTFPNGREKVFELPVKSVSKNAKKVLSAVFHVKPGRNVLTIRISTAYKLYRIWFDSLTLRKTGKTPRFEPLLRMTPDAFSGISHPGKPGTMTLHDPNTPSGTVRYTITDFHGKKTGSGEVALKDGSGKIELPAGKTGWFRVTAKVGGKTFESAYVVTEPVTPERIPDSRFGCHAINGATNTVNPKICWKEAEREKLHRAFLGGARNVRIHAFRWGDMEPKKGDYRFDQLEERVKAAAPYQFEILLNVHSTPMWASSSQNKKLTVVGSAKALSYPPKDWKDWEDFVRALMPEVKKLGISGVEIGNEPGYSSAFWGNGSPEDFARYLKTAYLTAKKIDPECKILSGAPLSVDFFEAVMKANDRKPYFDVMSVHYLRDQQRDSSKPRQWRDSLDRFAPGIPIVNTEESEYRNSNPGKAAVDLVKLYTREAKNGIGCTYAFQLFQDFGGYKPIYYGCFDPDGTPLPGFAAYRAMTHRLEHAKFVADLSTPEYEAYLFERKGTPVVVFWGENNGKLTLPAGTGDAELIDLMDCAGEISPVDGKFSAALGPEPQYLEGGNLELLKQWATVLKTFPPEFSATPKERIGRDIPAGKEFSLKSLTVPDGWDGGCGSTGFHFTVPKDTQPGIYEGAYVFSNQNGDIRLPFLVEVRLTPEGLRNQNGDFRRNTAFWFGLGKKKNVQVEKDGANRYLKITGPCHFGFCAGTKVRKGETYLLSCDIRGDGCIGGIATIRNRERKVLYPTRQGINCLYFTAGKNWRKVFCTIPITQDGAEWLKISFLSNFQKKYHNATLYADNFRLVRIGRGETVAGLLFNGKILPKTIEVDGDLSDWSNVPAMAVGDDSALVLPPRGKIKWNGPDDLSGTCRLAADANCLYVAFQVRDDKDVPGSGLKSPWDNDSIQFALAPEGERQDNFTEFVFCRDASGKAVVSKLRNIWTPEIPNGLTRRGILPGAKAAIRPIPDGMAYEAAIPWAELYPLNAKTRRFKFSWLLNDNDGAGRKYMQWSSGIGGSKNAGQFGSVSREK